MFIRFLHGLQSVIKKVFQHWTKEELPSEVMTKHDFHDDNGPVPAIPLDIITDTKSIINLSETRIDNSIILDTKSITEFSEIKLDNSELLHTNIITNYEELQLDNSTITFSNIIIDCQEIIA